MLSDQRGLWSPNVISEVLRIQPEAIEALPIRSCVMDGEAIVCDDNGLAVFDLIRGYGTSARAVLCAFDLPEVNGEDIRQEPTEDRKRRLARLPHDGIALNEHFSGDGAMILKHTWALGCEGTVSSGSGRPIAPDARRTGSRSRTRTRRRCDGSKKKIGLGRAASPPPLVGRQNGSMH